MIRVIDNDRDPRLQQAFALRAKILHDRWHWPVSVIGGLERDELDDLPPVHLLYYQEGSDQLDGYLRLLPTTGPTMLTRYFADVFKEQLRAPDIWEVSKFCLTDTILDLPYFSKAFHFATMLAGLGKFCWRHDIVSVTGVIDDRTRRAYESAGIQVDILEEADIDGRHCCNIVRHMDREWLSRTAAWFGDKILEQSELRSSSSPVTLTMSWRDAMSGR